MKSRIALEPKTKLILGSASSRRVDLFSNFTLPFQAISSSFDELSIPTSLAPKDYVSQIAEGKGSDLVKNYPNTPILTADTSVYFKGNFLNKPKDVSDAYRMLTEISDSEHEVWTALSLCLDEKVWTEVEVTKVTLYPLTDKQITTYIKTFKPLDKAGSYAIQDAAGLLIKKIDGDFYNVIGFPIAKVTELLKRIEIDLWDYLE